MNFKPKLLMLTCVLGLVMAFASSGYSQPIDGGAETAIMMDGGAEAAAPAATAPTAPAAVVPETALPVAAVTTAPAAGETALSKLSTELLNIFIPAFIALIGFLTTWILHKIRKKLHLNVSDQQVESWAKLADKAAGRGAEWARNKAKTLTDGKVVPGPEVLEVAVDWAVEMGRAFKLPEMGREKLVGLIEANLHAKRENSAHPLPLELPKAVVVSEG